MTTLKESLLFHIKQRRLDQKAIFAQSKVDSDPVIVIKQKPVSTPPPPQKPVEIEPKKPLPKIEPAPIKRAANAPLNQMIALIKSLNIEVLDKIPSDRIAKRINSAWKEQIDAKPIVILAHDASKPHLTFLQNLAKAIDRLILPCTLILTKRFEKENALEDFLDAKELKAIIAPDVAITGSLLSYLKEFPGTKKRQLKEKPLFLLPDLNLYLNEYKLKQSLWKALCQELQRYS